MEEVGKKRRWGSTEGGGKKVKAEDEQVNAVEKKISEVR